MISNQSALNERNKHTGRELETGKIKVLCRKIKLNSRKVIEAIFIKKRT